MVYTARLCPVCGASVTMYGQQTRSLGAYCSRACKDKDAEVWLERRDAKRARELATKRAWEAANKEGIAQARKAKKIAKKEATIAREAELATKRLGKMTDGRLASNKNRPCLSTTEGEKAEACMRIRANDRDDCIHYSGCLQRANMDNRPRVCLDPACPHYRAQTVDPHAALASRYSLFEAFCVS